MRRTIWVIIAVLGLSIGQRALGTTSAAQARQAAVRDVPTFQVDPSWPKIPNNWILGQVASVMVDEQDHVWLIHRFRTVKQDLTDKAAPPVLEFDAAGNFIKAWGGPGAGYEWPSSEHSIFVDYKGYVWIGGEGRGVNQVLKFTRDGTFVMQIGRSGQSKGLTDTQNFVGPTDIFVYPRTNELFVGDTGGHGRVIVMDADTGTFRRMWGGFGNPPTNPTSEAAADVDDGGDPPQLTEAHCLRISKDGFVYVCDGPNKRFQVFTIDGKFVSEVFINRGRKPSSIVPVVTTTGSDFETKWGEAYTAVAQEQLIDHHETASRLGLSTDPQQQYLYVYDRSRSKIIIFDRKTLTIIGEFGDGPGRAPGQFYIIHDISVDSQGNVYTGEVNINSRAQKFVLKGMMRPLAAR